MLRISLKFLRKTASLIVLVMFFCGSAYAHRDLTVVDWGGDLARAHMQAWVLPWEKEYNKSADLVYYGGGIGQIRDQVNTTNVTWDVVDMEFSDLIQACDEGLLEKFDHSMLADADSDFVEGALENECGVGIYTWATVYAYDTDVFTDRQPTSIADFFNTREFPGRRGLRKDPRGTLEWALMAVGIPANQVYAELSTVEGLNLAFASLDRLKSNIVWWSSGGEPARLLKDDTVTMTAAWNGRLHRPMLEDNEPIDIVWDGQLWEMEFLAIPKGSRNSENARQFIAFASSPRGMTEVTRYIPYGPVRKSAQANVPEEVKPYLPAENMSDTSLRFDSQWWADNITPIRERFEHWISPSGLDVQGRGARF